MPPVAGDTSVCKGSPVLLTVAGSDSVFWSLSQSYSGVFHSGFTLLLTQVNAPAIYYVFSQDGLCRSNFDSLRVMPDGACPDHDVLIPNVITPDGDGFNDFFPEPSPDYLLDIKIYDRWGILVFKSDKLIIEWDGKLSDGHPASNGNYFWIIEYTDIRNIQQNMAGTLSLFR